MEGFNHKAWVVSVEMGYGHQRAAFALQKIAKGQKVLNAGLYPGIPESDKKIWHELRLLYETISRFKNVPVLGDLVFSIFDKFQEIKEFYPKNQAIDHPTLQLKQMYGLIEKRNWGKHLIEKLNKSSLPLVATFPAIAFMAEYFGFKEEILLVVCDADVSRAWAPLNPSKSKIRYCVPTVVAGQRLERYGIPKHNIFFTGFPLPDSLTFKAKEDLIKRLRVLDPEGLYLKLYSDVVKRYLGEIPPKPKKNAPLTITFAVGGAGAQEEIGKAILQSLAPMLKEKKVKLNLVAGIRKDVAHFFEVALREQNLLPLLGKQLCIVWGKTLGDYFKKYNAVLRTTDIVWTKPSEMVFYAALGLPLIMSEPMGSQEVENRKWLLSVGAGIDEFDPKLTRHWMQDVLYSGRLAEAAMQGFVEIERGGVANITNIIYNH